MTSFQIARRPVTLTPEIVFQRLRGVAPEPVDVWSVRVEDSKADGAFRQ
ncbi:MAG TPA: hypothetical protein VM264_10365 [Acidimicrobiales bacterium]|jgi:hypothetical protein|nr:hypothetical protein [Acidimicrobiales bacterium]